MSELFPPAVGGSAVLLSNVYSRLSSGSVTVMTNNALVEPGLADGQRTTFETVRAPINGAYRGLRPPAAFKQHLRLARAIRRQASRRPTIVHCGRPAPEGAAALLSRKLPGQSPRYVSWVHGEDLAAAMTSREHRWLARRVCLGASTMIASSRFAGRLVETLGVPQTRIRVIHPGVDGSRFTGRVPRPVAHLEMPPEASPVLLSVGRLQRRKGHDTTIQAVALLGRHFPHLQYLIAGDGQERNRLEDLARASGIASRVAFLGEVPSEDLPGLYAACDIFVMPSRTDDHDVEGFGIVFLEAAAAGRPTIGGLSGGVPEAIADGETGLLVNGENPEALAEAIRTLAISPDLCARMGAAGRTRVLKSFTWERAAAELQALHDELSAESPV